VDFIVVGYCEIHCRVTAVVAAVVAVVVVKYGYVVYIKTGNPFIFSF
jgi:hypothetical protein